ncbi:MAG: hypothetical protein KDA92_09815 [Planctomycetales bacterium]|nr:hypothetical protein [Planctomycetales bacterium]MCA9167715.1 hypothetical protein [Planctomycetales bacterium]
MNGRRYRLIAMWCFLVATIAHLCFQPTFADIVRLELDGLVVDQNGGSFVIVASPEPQVAYVPGAYAVNIAFDVFSPDLTTIEFDTVGVLPDMIELGAGVGTTPHPGTLVEGDVIQYVAAGPTQVPGNGTSLMQVNFTVPGGFDPLTQGFRATIVPAHPSNPDLYVTFAGDGYDLELGSIDIGTPGTGFDLCDINRDGSCDVADIDALTLAIVEANTTSAMDLNADGNVDTLDRDYWVHDLMNLYYGDSNLDGVFDTSDLVLVLQAGQFEDDVVGNATWATGDWSGDLEFSTSDLITAFQDGGFEQGPRSAVAAVPEPASITLALFAGMLLLNQRRARVR